MNIAPIARLSANKTELTLPDNEVILDASGSTDANKNAVLSYRHYQTGGPGGITITNPNFVLAKVNVTQVGYYDMAVDVEDRGGLISTASISFNVKPKIVKVQTQFGAILVSGDVDQNINIAKQLGITCFRTSQNLDTWKGYNSTVDKYVKSGFKVLLNLNVTSSTNGASAFMKDMVKYRKLIEAVVTKYRSLELMVIENEATTDKFHTGPIEDYIALLKVAVDVCHQYGIKAADSGMALAYVQAVMSGHTSKTNEKETAKMIEAFKSIDLDYVNIHNAFSGNSFPVDGLTKVVNWLRNETGKEVMSNEWHLETASVSLMKDVVAAWKNVGVAYSIIYSGDSASNKNSPVSIKTTLTDIGKAYRDAIKY